MTTPSTFAEHADLGFSDAHAVADYLRRSGVTAETERARLESMGIGPENWLLEFGCGPGILAVDAARLCRHVTAIDPSAAMVQHARARAERAGITNITFVQAGMVPYAWILAGILHRAGFEVLDARNDPRQTYATYTCERREP